jgi:N-acetylmuramic acid 6-phosphate etherase
MNYQERAKEFLTISSQFKLGHLLTESFHPLSSDLSQLAKKDLVSAFSVLSQIDQEALSNFSFYREGIWKLHLKIKKVFSNQGRVFLCGCGATGRLSLALETLYRQKFLNSHQVFSFMAGGDFALIKSVESFEDHPEYGERQLVESGFRANDFLIASTEGGETPFVIGAALKATELSNEGASFLYCNPDELLSVIARSQEVLTNEKIEKLNLTVGPMAISGSTRMQASTVIMLAIGLALLYDFKGKDEFDYFFDTSLDQLKSLDYSPLSFLTQFEADAYKDEEYINYISDSNLAISVLTDTTERSPTFSLKGFENHRLSDFEKSLSYLFIKGAKDTKSAWESLLKRPPRGLEWKDIKVNISNEIIWGFDISEKGLTQRATSCKSKNFFISHQDESLLFDFDSLKANFHVGSDILLAHLSLKMLLNAHSTLIMGLLERYEGNVMTYVRPSNFKLIDRAARYVEYLLKRDGKVAVYSEIVGAIFKEMEKEEKGPIVLRVLRLF